MATLLEKALASRKYNRIEEFSEEEKELVLAWLADEIGVTQISKALKMNGTGNVYAFLARGAKQIFQEKGNKK